MFSKNTLSVTCIRMSVFLDESVNYISMDKNLGNVVETLLPIKIVSCYHV